MMFNKGATNSTMAAPAVANQLSANASPMADPWQNMRDVSQGFSIDPAKRDQMFQGMMEQPQQQAQFSPAQFGGGGNQQVLAQYIASLLGKG
jgi:hypothetical protein